MASSATATPDADKVYYADLVSFARLLYQQAEHDEHCTCYHPLEAQENSASGRCSKEESTSGCTIKVSWLQDTLPHLAGFSAYAATYIRDRTPMTQADDAGGSCSPDKYYIRLLIANFYNPGKSRISDSTPTKQRGIFDTTVPLASSVAPGAMCEADSTLTPLDACGDKLGSPPLDPHIVCNDTTPADMTVSGMSSAPSSPSTTMTESPLPQLLSRLVEAENTLAHAEHQTHLAVLEQRVNEVMLAMGYNEKLYNSHEKHMQGSKGASVKHTDECDCLRTETVLDEMIHEAFPSKSSDDHLIDAGEFPREKLREWIGLGQFFLKLIAEFGWGAMICPGLCIEQDDLKEMGQEELDEITESIQYHYGTTAWRKELLDISPTIFTLITQGIPEGQTLRILTVPDGG
ncbi:hypothetical protein MRS44_013581 [Fusarium solani]|uniref:uncharacterized protein n=1 Tax=Fusarium solani TaxID=169388 RepID=UPI0032C43FC9|nr:hypothetical protein MRS44_013581 [Fusarium solani]